ncbi:hypothetical protein GGI24_003042 [Coemansia furcata]|nr:hypothetical protein GGI24_003042 [Coemansia furcata]
MEALLAARAAVARARDPLLLIGYAGAAGAAAADDAHVAAASYSEHAALRRAVAVAGPTVPANDRWLVGADAGSGHLRWEQLASPPLVPAQLLADEPGFSAYSRCRVLALPVAAEAGGLVVVTMPHVGDSAPAYRGEAFAVEIVVRNAHARLPAVGVAVDVRLASGLGDDVADSMTNLNVASSDASESGGGGAEPAVEAASNAPWLTAAEDGDDGNGSRARELLGVLAGGSAADLAPGESRTVTVFVNFPAAQLSSASQSTATDLAVVRCTVRYSTASSESPIHVIAQASIPVARPLYATAELLPAHVAAPDALPTPASATGGEFCFRRPVLVTLHNAGPWDVTVDRMALHPPSAEALSQALSAAGAAPMRMAVAGATAPSATLSAGGSLQHVFWVDITTRDLVRLAGDVCPGVLHVDWRRAASGSACVARLWLPAMRLVARRLTVESLCEAPVARVGQALGLGYRLTNLTRRARTLDVAMHATEAFVFAGPRRATITVLPGCATVLRFCLLSLTAATSATSATNPVSTAFAPGFAVFQDKGNATGLGWVRLPRLEIKDRENPAMSPSSAASLVVAAAPPPTRAAPSVLAASPEASVLAAAQRTVAALAVVGDVDRPLTPGLAAQCIDVLPPALVYGASGGVESDFEDEDEEKDDDERPADVDDDDDEILRLDQTAIYCLPAKD